jgi:hypothetical protein
MSHSLTSVELVPSITLTRPESAHASHKSDNREQNHPRRRSSVLLSRPQLFRQLTTENVSEDEVSKSQTVIVISSVTVITGISSLLAGLVTVGLPTIARDLSIPPGLVLWYVLGFLVIRPLFLLQLGFYSKSLIFPIA